MGSMLCKSVFYCTDAGLSCALLSRAEGFDHSVTFEAYRMGSAFLREAAQ